MHEKLKKFRKLITSSPDSKDEELCEALDVNEEKLAELRQVDRQSRIVSLSKPISEDESRTLGDIIVDVADNELSTDEVIAQNDLYASIEACLQRLSARESDIITRYFGLRGQKSETLRQIAEDYGVAGETIRKTKLSAQSKIQRILTEMGYSDYADLM